MRFWALEPNHTLGLGVAQVRLYILDQVQWEVTQFLDPTSNS